MKPVFAALCLMVFCAPAWAEEVDNTCREGHFAMEGSYKLAKIKGAAKEKILFQNDDDNSKTMDNDHESCPNLDISICPMKRHLIPGDQVVTKRQFKEFTCSGFQSKRGFITGWVPTAALENLPVEIVPLKDWVGTWSDGEDSITIRLGKTDGLEVDGDAVWHGGENTYGDKIVHTGQFAGSGTPKLNTLHIEEAESGCIVDMERVGTYMIVRDNDHCGGLNARFQDVYHRQ